jgi:hypothetical protein
MLKSPHFNALNCIRRALDAKKAGRRRQARPRREYAGLFLPCLFVTIGQPYDTQDAQDDGPTVLKGAKRVRPMSPPGRSSSKRHKSAAAPGPERGQKRTRQQSPEDQGPGKRLKFSIPAVRRPPVLSTWDRRARKFALPLPSRDASHVSRDSPPAPLWESDGPVSAGGECASSLSHLIVDTLCISCNTTHSS